jgi:S1-C subfamily serine protease
VFRCLSLVLLILVLNPIGAWTQAPRPTSKSSRVLSTKQVVERASHALVLITTRTEQGEDAAQGSGFFIGKNLVATNLHVFKWASRATGKLLADGVDYPISEVVRFDVRNDTCLLLVESAEAIPLAVGESEKATVGDDIIVAGNPRGLEGTFSKGIISCLRRDPDLLQIDTPISPGSSGGPVLNMRGEVIGIASSSLISGQSLNFAVPIDLLPLVPSVSISIRVAGSLAVTDRERDGLSGLVHRRAHSTTTIHTWIRMCAATR